MNQQIVLSVGSFGLAVIGMLLFWAVLLVVARSGSFARARALSLLEEWLSPEQRACYERFRHSTSNCWARTMTDHDWALQMVHFRGASKILSAAAF